jgi:hypothetical protein
MKNFPKYDSFYSIKKEKNSFLGERIDLHLRLNIKKPPD